VSELETELARQSRAARTQAALYRIAELSARAQDLDEFYKGIHAILGELLYAENIYIALVDEARREINFAYYADTVDTDWPDPRAWEPYGQGHTKGVTGYIVRTGKPIHHTRAEFLAMVEAGELNPVGELSNDFLGVPLVTEGRTVGVLAVQSYREDIAYSDADEQLLTFVGQHIAAALERARNATELRQRNAELAVVNEIGTALAQQLEFQAVIDLVGEHIRSMFEAPTSMILLYDAATNLLSPVYFVDNGERASLPAPRTLGPGLASEIITSRDALRLNTNAEGEAHGQIVFGSNVAESYLGVPILASDRVLGVISLERVPAYAFSDSDERLLSTLAATMGVALENARLFDETKRLLGETEQRNAELAVVNEIGAALAKQLDFESIIELVGERLAAMFKSQDMFIALYDRVTNLITFPFELAEGRRVHGDPIMLGQGLTTQILQSGRSLRFGTSADQQSQGAFAGTYAEGNVGTAGESWLGVPIMSGSDPIGAVVFSDLRTDAFSEADERLVSTIVLSMSVALENARLFEQTNVLLAETKERAAELSIINSVQQGLAGRLEIQSMYELVGDKIREIFNAQSVDISVLDREAGLLRFVYSIEKGVRTNEDPIGIIGFRRHVLESGEPLSLSGDMTEIAPRYGNPLVLSGEVPRSALFVPLIAGGAGTGVISLQDIDRENAFTDGDVRLLTTLAASLSVALQNVRLFDETKRLLGETEQRNAELAVVNEIGTALDKQLDFQAIIDAVGDRVGQILGSGELSIAILDSTTNMISFPYWIEDGKREPNLEPIPLGKGLNSHVIQTGRPLRLGTADEAEALGVRWVGARTESYLAAPIRTGERVFGVLSVSDKKAHAFTEADERLLSTLSASMGVALENARLFDETKRLLAESNERAAELAIINSVQHGRGPRECAAVRRDEAAPGREQRARRRAGDHQQRPAGPGRAAGAAGDVRPRRREDRRDLRRPWCRHRAL